MSPWPSISRRDDGIDYLVTEYVPGITLDSKLAGRAAPGR